MGVFSEIIAYGNINGSSICEAGANKDVTLNEELQGFASIKMTGKIDER
jgi:hypothetical protein